jgi:hypothetical protein
MSDAPAQLCGAQSLAFWALWYKPECKHHGVEDNSSTLVIWFSSLIFGAQSESAVEL